MEHVARELSNNSFYHLQFCNPKILASCYLQSKIAMVFPNDS